MLKGIDVSSHQGLINWNRVKAAGIDFAMIRAGYGNNNIDKQFVRNITECNKLGIPVGVYWFSYALSAKMAADEAKACLAAIRPYRVEWPVVYDLEYDTLRYAGTKGVTIGRKMASDMVRAFCGEVEKAGYYAMNYSNLDYLRNMFEPELRKDYDLWYAQYSSAISKDAGQVWLWQHTDKGKVDGITGNVDLNIAYRDYKAIIERAGLNSPAKKISVTIETNQTRDELITALTKAGFKVREV